MKVEKLREVRAMKPSVDGKKINKNEFYSSLSRGGNLRRVLKTLILRYILLCSSEMLPLAQIFFYSKQIFDYTFFIPYESIKHILIVAVNITLVVC